MRKVVLRRLVGMLVFLVSLFSPLLLVSLFIGGSESIYVRGDSNEGALTPGA